MIGPFDFFLQQQLHFLVPLQRLLRQAEVKWFSVDQQPDGNTCWSHKLATNWFEVTFPWISIEQAKVRLKDVTHLMNIERNIYMPPTCYHPHVFTCLDM